MTFTRQAIALFALGIVLLVMTGLLLRSCEKRRSAASQARVERSQAEAASNSARDAIGTVAGVGRNEAASEALTRENEGNIRAADGANDAVKPGVRDAGIAALCRRKAYQNDPRCQ